MKGFSLALVRRALVWHRRRCVVREQRSLLASGPALKVLLFHGLYDDAVGGCPSDVDPTLAIPLSTFRRHLQETIKQGFRFIHPDQIHEICSSRERLALLTFDDGYANNLLAMSVLREMAVPALIFVTTDALVRRRAYWWDVVAKEGKQRGLMPAQMSELRRCLKKLPPKELETTMCSNFGATCYDDPSEEARPLTVDELRQLAQDKLVQIGNHTHCHALLPQLNEADVRWELQECQRTLTEITGDAPRALAYPNGRWNETVAQAARAEGIQFAFTTHRALCPLPLPAAFNFSIPRLQPEP